ncbi:MAG: Ldh family oxidoreductase [Rhizobiales bacterium]|nr:Ldh family oxidoreductase [Hyphomicrobiales bacterium]
MDQVNTSSRVPAQTVVTLITDCLNAVGLPGADALKVAELMLEADLTGADAHGVFRLPQYVKRLRAGGVNPKPTIRVEKTAAATAMVDGDNGMGHLVMARAAETAIELAREAGMGWVGARGSNHAGAAGVYAAMPLPHGMVGIYSVVASANHMPVWGGVESLLGTNPLAVAIPAGEEPPLVLDVATSVVSYGTIKSHRLQGKPLPEGWMVNTKDGTPLTDPARSSEGVLLPVGGYKGSGLALVLGLLAGPLNRAAFGRDVFDFNYNDTDVANTGHFIIALDVKRFTPGDTFKAEMDRHLRDLRTSKPLPGFDRVRLPGQERSARRADRLKNGVPLPRELTAQLDTLAGDLGVKPLAAR